MPNSALRSFRDPDEYDGAIRAGSFSGLRLARGEFRAELTRVDLGGVWMQRFRESAARSARVAPHASRSAVLFRTPEEGGVLSHRGNEVDDATLVFFGAGTVDDQFSNGPVGFGTMSLAPADLARFGALIGEADLASPRATTALRPDPAALARLRFLHQAAARLARTDPGRIDHPQVARALEDAFVGAMVRCLAGGRPAPAWRPGERRGALIRRMEELLAGRRSLPVYVTDLCQSLGVGERALERACQDFLGMGPKRYLWLRRLHLARRSLVETDASQTTVAQVALAHGFWELGRFAVQYRQAFGERPSETLRRPKRDHAAPSNPLVL